MKKFIVLAKSINTNSFGLFQMILVAEDGEAFKSCVSCLNVSEEGETITQVDGIFHGHELTEKIDDAPKQIIKRLFS